MANLLERTEASIMSEIQQCRAQINRCIKKGESISSLLDRWENLQNKHTKVIRKIDKYKKRKNK